MKPYAKYHDRDASHPNGKPTPKHARDKTEKGAVRLAATVDISREVDGIEPEPDDDADDVIVLPDPPDTPTTNDPDKDRKLGTNRIRVGCWIDTRWGRSVVTYMDEKWVFFRYAANRVPDGPTIWVANGELLADVAYASGPDAPSQHVLTLKGPYGED